MEDSHDSSSLTQLPTIVQSVAANVPESYRQRAAAFAFRLIAGASAKRIASASGSFDMLKARSLVTQRVAEAAAERAASKS